MSPGLIQLLVALALTVITGYFATARAALDRMTVARAARLVDEDRAGAARVVALLEGASRSWSALTLLIVLPFVTSVALVTAVLLDRLSTGPAIAAAVAVTAVTGYVAVDLVPRSVALRRPEDIACRTAGPVTAATTLLKLPAMLLVWAGGRILPGAEDGAEAFVTEEAIRDLIDEAEGQSIEPSERAMIHSIFELGDTLVREIMVPRPDVVMVSVAQPLSEVVGVILDHGYSRIPVHRGDERDDIAGVLYAKDVLKRIHFEGSEEGDWEEMIRAPYVVPELKSVDTLLSELQAEQVHLAVVVDEYGALAGIATIEDVLEEIVGEIVDEYDSEEALVEVEGDGVWRVDARLQVSALEEITQTDLPDDDWDTVGGLLYGVLGHVPRTGESVELDTARLSAVKVRGRRIVEVLVERIDPEADEETSLTVDSHDADGSREESTNGGRTRDQVEAGVTEESAR
ncbi:hemolysin family protein [Euzebya tangerina]|uniref:hemolysin family protein n=1 Tax=Euzebya tangerina TaxID=591198 RepID=UPI000E3138DD|nr:hemolysin family protein [Euzebya tangerina]